MNKYWRILILATSLLGTSWTASARQPQLAKEVAERVASREGRLGSPLKELEDFELVTHDDRLLTIPLSVATPAWEKWEIEVPKKRVGVPRVQITSSGGSFAVQVVESDFMALSDAGFDGLIEVTRIQWNARIDRNINVVGPVRDGGLALRALDYYYRQRYPITYKNSVDDIALFYLVKALRLQANQPTSILPSLNDVRVALNSLGQPDKEREALTRLLWTGLPQPSNIQHDRLEEPESPLDRAITFMAARQKTVPPVLATLNKNPKQFAYLPALYRLERALRTLLPKDQTTDKNRQQWLKLLEDEIKVRLDPAHPNSMAWDPQAMAQLTVLQLNHSPEYMELVRLPADGGQFESKEEFLKAVQQAIQKDPMLKRLNAIGHPKWEAKSDPSDEFVWLLRVTWTRTFRGHADPIVLTLRDAVRTGAKPDTIPDPKKPKEAMAATDTPAKPGPKDPAVQPTPAPKPAPAKGNKSGGQPVPPGILATEGIHLRRSSFQSQELELTLAGIAEGDYIPALPDLLSGSRDVKNRQRWHQVADVKKHTGLKLIQLVSDHGSLTGTSTQRVLSRRNNGRWRWMTLGEIEKADQLWRTGGHATIEAKHQIESGPDCLELTVSGTDNGVLKSGFVVRWNEKTVEATSRHGIEATALVRISAPDEELQALSLQDLQIEWGKSTDFPKLTSYSILAQKVTSGPDLLINCTKDHSVTVIRVVYALKGNRRSIATHASHGFAVVGESKAVEARTLRIGDRLLTGNPDLPSVEIVEVFQETSSHQSPTLLYHPRLIKRTWLNVNGVLVHTDFDKRKPPGLDEETLLTVIRPPRDEELGWRIFTDVEVKQIVPYEPSSTRAHVFPGFWPEAPRSTPRFQPLPARRNRVRYSAELVVLSTKNDRHLRCGPSTTLWQVQRLARSAEINARPVPAGSLTRGVEILVQTGLSGESPELGIDMVDSIQRLDSFEETETGFFELFFPGVHLSSRREIADDQRRFSNLPAGGILISLATTPDEQVDLWVRGDRTPGPAPGSGAGTSSGGAISMVADAPVAGEAADQPSDSKIAKPDRGQANSNSSAAGRDEHDALGQYRKRPKWVPPTGMFDWSGADLKKLLASSEHLERCVDAVRRPAVISSPRHTDRFARFKDSFRQLGSRASLLDLPQLLNDLAVYQHHRRALLRGEPAALRELATTGVPLVFRWLDAGSPRVAGALLQDILTIQARLVLRDQSLMKNLWTEGEYGVRNAWRFALEYEQLAGATSARRTDGLPMVAGRRLSAAHWDDLLSSAVQDGRLNEDVMVTDKEVHLYRLILGLDYATASTDLSLEGYIHKNFDPLRPFLGEIARRP